jgi:hypothetical protein
MSKTQRRAGAGAGAGKKRERRNSAARKWAEQKQTGFVRTAYHVPEGMSIFRPKAGTYRLDIVPYVVEAKGHTIVKPGDLYWEKSFTIHRDVGVNRDAYTCPRAFGKPCPICDYQRSLKDQPNADKDTIKSLYPKDRQLMMVFDHGDKDKGVQLWEESFHNFGKLLKTRLESQSEEDAEEDGFWDEFYFPEDGFTLIVTFVEEEIGQNSFVKAASIDFRARRADLAEDVLEQAVDLDTLPILTDYKKLEAIFFQAPDPEEDEDEEPKPSRSTRPTNTGKPAKGKKPEPEPEEEDEEEPEDGDEYGDDVTDEFPDTPDGWSVYRDGKRYNVVDDDGELVGENLTKRAADALIDEEGGGEEPEEEDEEEPEEKPKARRSSRKPEPEPEEEDDFDEDEEEPEEEDEPVKPAKGKKAPAKPSKPAKGKKPEPEEEDDFDEDWNFDEDEEEEPEEKPKARRKGK